MLAIRPEPAPADPNPATFLVGRDPAGTWVAVDERGLGGGLFVSREAAWHYAATETGRRPDAVRLATGPVVLTASRA